MRAIEPRDLVERYSSFVSGSLKQKRASKIISRNDENPLRPPASMLTLQLLVI